ncbi:MULTISPECIES: AEC family transporter [unclassified Oleiphilus]|nr:MULTISPECIES: AEC family transporter [unclassified Oleiphilus]KZY47966.1 permease [Oleiphilus sp. HI0050]KZY77115.1 permease [Oleiphilus sp. HI0069]KZY77125.1 permease [Oleiphilus sp. HI0068]KZY85834.1 permease [Oleiphilus sp. HI0072]KZZ31583.1 permease [Oleiphilus sp. HI0085]
MSSFLDLLLYTSNITLPIFIIVFLGWFLRRTSWLTESFINSGSKLVFTIALPALLFIKVLESDLSAVFDTRQVMFALLVTVAGFLACWRLSGTMKLLPENRGVFVQGAFRGNMGIVGLALCMNMYGDEGLAVGSILLAFLTLLYNVLSVFALTLPFHSDKRFDWLSMAKDMAKNPLIIAIVTALVLNLLQLEPPAIIMKSGEYFANMTLPLALICVGGSIKLNELKDSNHLALKATLLKLVGLPLLFTLAALVMGFKDLALGTLFLMFASPTATASFVMAKAMRGNAELAATIIALSTVLSLLTVSTGIFVLRALGLA